MLTEVGHGLDAKNLETEVILQQDGSFILNIPHGEASKYDAPILACLSGTDARSFA